MQPEARSGQREAVQAHPLAELLDCPAAVGSVLNGSTRCIDFQAGGVVFRQSSPCMGLSVIVSGHFLRKAERLETRLTLGPARPGDLVELAAALGEVPHTFTLTAQTPGSALLLPIEALNEAFRTYPPLRMQLLEELAREVCRAYYACCLQSGMKSRRHSTGTAMA